MILLSDIIKTILERRLEEARKERDRKQISQWSFLKCVLSSTNQEQSHCAP